MLASVAMGRSPNKLNIKAFRKLIMRYLIDSLIIAGECFSQFEANMVLNIDESCGGGGGIWISIVMRKHC